MGRGQAWQAGTMTTTTRSGGRGGCWPPRWSLAPSADRNGAGWRCSFLSREDWARRETPGDAAFWEWFWLRVCSLLLMAQGGETLKKALEVGVRVCCNNLPPYLVQMSKKLEALKSLEKNTVPRCGGPRPKGSHNTVARSVSAIAIVSLTKPGQVSAAQGPQEIWPPH